MSASFQQNGARATIILALTKRELYGATINALAIISQLEKLLLLLMQQIYDFIRRHEVKRRRLKYSVFGVPYML